MYRQNCRQNVDVKAHTDDRDYLIMGTVRACAISAFKAAAGSVLCLFRTTDHTMLGGGIWAASFGTCNGLPTGHNLQLWVAQNILEQLNTYILRIIAL